MNTPITVYPIPAEVCAKLAQIARDTGQRVSISRDYAQIAAYDPSGRAGYCDNPSCAVTLFAHFADACKSFTPFEHDDPLGAALDWMQAKASEAMKQNAPEVQNA